MTITQPYVYFVSYNLTTADGRTGFGSGDVVYDRPVTRFTDVEVLTQKMCEGLATRGVNVPLSNVVILNYRLLSGPTGNDGDNRLAVAEKALRDIASMVEQFDTPRDAGRVRAFVGDVGQVACKGLGE